MDDVTFDMVCFPSEDIVAREIEGELIIVPLVAGIGDTDDELYTLNETGKAIWSRLDGKRTLRAISEELATEFNAPLEEVGKDLSGLMNELIRRKMILVQSV
jgi:hypothetical protein